MRSAPRRSKRACWPPLLLVLWTLGAAAAPPPATSSLDAAVAIELRSQPLGEALRRLAKQANLQILFDAALVTGRSAPAIRGNLTPRSALDELLQGTGLEAWEQAPGVVVIRCRDKCPSDAKDREEPRVQTAG